jgi:hypothetical protein
MEFKCDIKKGFTGYYWMLYNSEAFIEARGCFHTRELAESDMNNFISKLNTYKNIEVKDE